MSTQTKHPLRIWFNESRWKLTDEGKYNNHAIEMMQKEISFHEMSENIEIMAEKGWIERKYIKNGGNHK